jgi:hypothetical protein
MDTAQVEVRMSDVRRLLAELGEVARVLFRFGSKGASEIKHPSTRKTRVHLAKDALQEKSDRRWTA